METPPIDPRLLDAVYGWPLVRIQTFHKDGKAPYGDAWNKRPVNAAEIESWNQGFGVLLGGKTRLIDIEYDGPLAAEDCKDFFGTSDLPETCGWQSTLGIHRIYRVPEDVAEQIGHIGVPKFGQLEIRWGRPDCHLPQSVMPFEWLAADGEIKDNNKKWMKGPQSLIDLPDFMAQRLIAHANEKQDIEARKIVRKPGEGNRPGDIYDNKADFASDIAKVGWEKTSEKDCGTFIAEYFKHPGTDKVHSASLNWEGNGRLHLFTSSIPGMEAGQSYSPHQFMAHTQFGSDFSACAIYLRNELDCVPTFDASMFLDAPEAKDEETFSHYTPTQVLDREGLIKDFATWHHLRVPGRRQDYRAGLAVGMLAASLTMGRKYQMPDGTPSQLALCLLGESGSGKTSAFQSLQLFLDRLGLGDVFTDNIGSGQGMKKHIAQHPRCVFFVDEAQKLLASMGDPDKYPHYASQADEITKFRDYAKAKMYPRALASKPDIETVVTRPCAVVGFGGVERQIWPALGDNFCTGGLLGRILFIDLKQEILPEVRPPDQAAYAEECLERCIKHARMRMETSTDPAVLEKQAIEFVDDPPDIVYATLGQEVVDRLYQYERETRNAQIDDTHSEVQVALLKRAHELASKIALAFAGAQYTKDVHVDLDILVQAIEVTDTNTKYKLAGVINRPLDPKFIAYAQKILDKMQLLANSGDKCPVLSVLTKKLGCSKAHCGEALGFLVSNQQLFSNATFDGEYRRILDYGPHFCLPKHRKLLETKISQQKKEIEDEQTRN